MSRWRQWLLVFVVLLFSSGAAFTAGVAAERDGLLPGAIHSEPSELTKRFSVFWEAWSLVQENFVERSALDTQEMTYGAIEGLITSLGDTGHTRFLTPEDAAMQSSDISGQFFGIGAELGQRDGNPIIVAPLDDSPAEKAGILAGDFLVEVDGQPVAGMSLDKVVRIVRGPEGTTVTLTVVHPGEMSLTEIAIVRARITVHPISWAMIPGTQVAHLRISQFNANVNRELVGALGEIRSSQATGVVLDVRNNSGGLLDQCVAATSQFVSGGNVLVEQDANGKRKAHPVAPGGRGTDFPVVVLINRGTASAAEILAGAIQDHGRGQLVGETSFGTGTVLSPFSLSDGSALLLGTSQWLTPNGRQIWKNGVAPDVKVALPPGTPPVTPTKLKSMSPEQLRDAKDTQLQRAVEVLTGVVEPGAGAREPVGAGR